jgi:methionyl-tRNA synthetase
MKEIAFGGDGDFSWERYDERYNVDLANNLGNLVSRVSAMAARYAGGTVRPSGAASERLARTGEQAAIAYRRAMDRLALHEGVAAAFSIVDATNEYIAETAPWALARDPTNADRVTQVLFDAAEAIRLAAVLLSPVMPASAREVLRRIGAGDEPLQLDRDGSWRTTGERALVNAEPLWPRLDLARSGKAEHHASGTLTSHKENPVSEGPEVSTSAPRSPEPPTQDASAPPPSDRISIDDFMKVELRVAKVLAAERVPKSKKLLKLSVDVGTEQRTLVAGIAEAYEPEALVGRSVVIVFNLQPATLMGVESNGMVLAASPEGGKPMLLSFEEPPPPGTRVR